MNTTTEIQTTKGFIEPFPSETGTSERFESSWSLSKDLGKGSFQKIVFHPGFDMYIMDCRLKKCAVLKATASPSVVCMRFNLCGQNAVNIHNLGNSFSTTAQHNSLFYFNKPETSGYAPGNQELRGVSIHLVPSLLFSLLGKETACISSLRPLAEGANVPFMNYSGKTTSTMQMVLHQIINCPYSGPTRKIFLESKALELLALKLEQITDPKDESRATANRISHDVERIRHAGDILLRDIETPPSLSELGKAVGLSRTKLHVEFCKYYGTTPYAFLREARLNKAKLMLEQGMMNVTEAAFSVGFSSLSHFAKTFKIRFGVTPGKCLQKTVPIRKTDVSVMPAK